MTSVGSRPWPAGAATGIGSLPGIDPREAVTTVFGELPDFPHLPELPARGPGAGIVGRSAALLVDLPVEIVPSGWRLAAHAGRDLRRARDFLAFDLDALQTGADGYAGPLKIQAAGPWTLAASLELPTGHRVVSDAGAVRDLAASLREGLRLHVADVAARVPGAEVVLQLDEPGLPRVLAGRVPTPAGDGVVAAVERSVAAETVAGVLDVVPVARRAVHCCAPDVPLALLRSAGAAAIALDLDLLAASALDEIGECVDAGVSLWLGLVQGVAQGVPQGTSSGPIDQAGARARVEKLWAQLGFPMSSAAAAVVPTPACGLAGATDADARRAMAVVRDVGHALLDVA